MDAVWIHFGESTEPRSMSEPLPCPNPENAPQECLDSSRGALHALGACQSARFASVLHCASALEVWTVWRWPPQAGSEMTEAVLEVTGCCIRDEKSEISKAKRISLFVGVTSIAFRLLASGNEHVYLLPLA